MGWFRRRRSTVAPVEVVLYSRHGCHLCDEAQAIVGGIADELGVTVSVLDIDADPVLRQRWSDQVPVVVIDGRVHAVWRVDPVGLRAALTRGRDGQG